MKGGEAVALCHYFLLSQAPYIAMAGLYTMTYISEKYCEGYTKNFASVSSTLGLLMPGHTLLI